MDNASLDPTFRPIHYLGSKLRVLDAIEKTIDSIDPESNGVCDLFSGSGSVSSYLSQNRTVVSVDIQEYSRVLCSALLGSKNKISLDKFMSSIQSSSLLLDLTSAVAPLVDYEKKAMALAYESSPESLCEFLEEGSIIKFQLDQNPETSVELKKALNETLRELDHCGLNDSPQSLVTRYYGGIYFSFAQALQIDVILDQIFSMRAGSNRDVMLASLLSTVSDIVNTVGKQFAQPIRPRNKDGQPKSNLSSLVSRDRDKDIFSIYKKWTNTYCNRPSTDHPHKALRMNFSEAFDHLPKEIKVIYADPPYTRDHYSRFYHVLETIALRDCPQISRTKIGGKERMSRGLYRVDRHQSPFCIRSKAPIAFQNMFQKTAKMGASMVLSYSPFDKEANEHPRVVSTDDLMMLMKKSFKSVRVQKVDGISHSKLNHREKELSRSTPSEILIIGTN